MKGLKQKNKVKCTQTIAINICNNLAAKAKILQFDVFAFVSGKRECGGRENICSKCFPYM